MEFIFLIVALLIQPLFAWYVYHKQDKRKAAQKMPMIYVSVVYFVVQILVFFGVCIKIPKNLHVISYLIQAVILAVFIVIELMLLASNKYIDDIQEKEQNSIRDFKQLIRELEICKVSVVDENNLKRIDMLYEKMRYSDPVSSSEVAGENEKIHDLIQQLSVITDAEQFDSKCKEIEQQLEIRKIKNVKEQG